MSLDRNGPITKLSVFLRGPHAKKKQVKVHNPSIKELEPKILFKKYRCLRYSFLRLVKCASTLLMITFDRYELMKFLLQFFVCLLLIFFIFYSTKLNPYVTPPPPPPMPLLLHGPWTIDNFSLFYVFQASHKYINRVR